MRWHAKVRVSRFYGSHSFRYAFATARKMFRMVPRRLIPRNFLESNHLGPVAQRSEQGTHNPLVGGSNPSGPTCKPTTYVDTPLATGTQSGTHSGFGDKQSGNRRRSSHQLRLPSANLGHFTLSGTIHSPKPIRVQSHAQHPRDRQLTGRPPVSVLGVAACVPLRRPALG